MDETKNEFDQLVGFSVEGWGGCTFPPHREIIGRYCRLEPLNIEKHAQQLYDAHTANRNDADWTYLPYGPFDTFEAYRDWLSTVETTKDPQFYAVFDLIRQKALGVASYLRINPTSASIEVGHIHFAPALRQTPMATEAMFLMMQRAFELGYRRYEWKCDSLNEPSRAAALRFGFRYESLFRQATMYKGRNRDTSWFSIIDSEWPALKMAYEAWLDPANFSELGQQHNRLSDLIDQIRSVYS